MRAFVMRRSRQSRLRLLKDFLRLAHADDLLSRLGTLMMRTSPKATLWTAGIMSSGYLSNRIGLPGFTGLEALLGPAVVGGGMLGLGMAIRFVPAVFSARWLAVAEASDLNLMEDYRKAQAPAHLNALWDRVFFHEAAIRYRPEERQAEGDAVRRLRDYVRQQIRTWDPATLGHLQLGSEATVDAAATAVLSEQALSHIEEKSREGFILSSLFALRHPLPQCSEAHEVGFRLSLYEDFCDGAYFDPSDVKLSQQYAGSPLLLDVKKAVGFGRIDALRQLPASLAARAWCFLVTRKIATNVGRAVHHLNRRYGTDAFNAQVLLWPGQETAPWLDGYPGAAEAILTLRKSVVRSALGRDYDSARAVLDRMFLACFEFATDLRARYDPQYCDRSLDYVTEDTGEKIADNLVADLRTRGYHPRVIDSAAAYANTVRQEQIELTDYLTQAGRTQILKDARALRAVRIALHIDCEGIKDDFRTRESPDAGTSLDRKITAAAATKEACERRLVGLRLHHQLTLLLLDGYRDLARTLAY